MYRSNLTPQVIEELAVDGTLCAPRDKLRKCVRGTHGKKRANSEHNAESERQYQRVD